MSKQPKCWTEATHIWVTTRSVHWGGEDCILIPVFRPCIVDDYGDGTFSIEFADGEDITLNGLPEHVIPIDEPGRPGCFNSRLKYIGCFASIDGAWLHDPEDDDAEDAE